MARPIAAQSELVIVREGARGSDAVYHRPGCPVIKDGKGVLALTRAEAESRGYKSHHDCDPAFAKERGASPPSAAPAPAAKVFIDSGGKYYHRKDCPRLGSGVKEVAVTAVGKRWPCPACK